MTLTADPVEVPTAVDRRQVLAHRALRYLPAGLGVVDVLMISVAGLVAVVGRRRLPWFGETADVAEKLGMVGPAMLLLWLLCLVAAGSYREKVLGAGTEELKRVLHASFVAGGVTAATCYLTSFELSRGFVCLAFGVGLPLLLAGRLTVRSALQAARARSLLTRRALLVGSRAHVDDVTRVLRRERWLGYELVGALTPEYDLGEETPMGLPVLGDADDAPCLAQRHDVETIIFAGGSVGCAKEMREMFWTLERKNISVVMAPSVTDISSERVSIRPVGGLPLIHIDPPTWTDASRWGKRLFDIAGSLCLLLAFSLVLLAVAVRIKLHDGGPVLFAHTRAGRQGVEFSCLKFRTMVVDAEARVARMQVERGESALLFKVKDDPRITTPGRWMRRLSIDELPQLVNVLRGDMSLVGPRPQVAQEVALYDHAMSRRLHVRPGMTGLWQVSGRNDLTVEEAVRLDLYYVDNWSMVQDLSILKRTARAVLGSHGAY